MHHAQHAQYSRLRASAVKEWHEAARKLAQDPEQIVAGIQEAFPAANRLGCYFHFSTNLYQIQVPERLQVELVSLADQQEIVQAR